MKNTLHSAWSALLAWSACTAATAAGLPPPSVPPQLEAASVAHLGLSATFSVDRLKTTLLPGDDLGYVSTGMFCAGRQAVRANEAVVKSTGALETSVAIQLLKKLGYPMASLGGASAYNSDVASAPDYRLGGVIREVKFDICRNGNESEGWFYIKIDWALYSEREQKVVYQLTTEGLAASGKKVPDLERKGVLSSVENFIGAPEFLATIKPDAAAMLGTAGASAPAAAAPSAAEPGEAKPPSVTVLQPVKAQGQNLKVKLGVDSLKIGMLPGDSMGRATFGVFCNNAQPLSVGENFTRNFGGFVANVVQRSLRKNGYPLASQSKTSAFDTEQVAAADFRIGGVVKEVRMEVCNGVNVSEGWIYAKIDWALFSEKAKRVVFQRTTEGFALSKQKIPDLNNLALTVAFENFLAASEVMAALTAASDAEMAQAASAAAPFASAPSGTPQVAGTGTSPLLRLSSELAQPGGAQKNQARLRAAVVTLETANGSGSGFYLDRQGYLLTNFHVVSGAKFVKVRLLNGDKLVAEVVKVSERDDIALLKSVPVDFDPLAIRPEALEVGEEVFAIGTPLGVLTSTMTRGVLSADRVSQGVHELQSDAAVTFGSSGGPLLDGEGRVVGITKGGLRGEKGFNFFIPVQDALRALDIALGQR